MQNHGKYEHRTETCTLTKLAKRLDAMSNDGGWELITVVLAPGVDGHTADDEQRVHSVLRRLNHHGR